MTNIIARKLISQEEGDKLKAYKDHLGKLTVGRGHLLDQEQSPEELEVLGTNTFDENFTITQEQSDALFEIDYDEAVEDIVFILPDFDEIDEVRQAVLISQVFQLGMGGVRKFKNYLASVRGRDWDAAAEHSMDSLAARQTPDRWKRQAEMLRTGENPFAEEFEEASEDKEELFESLTIDDVIQQLNKHEKLLQNIYDYLISKK